MVNACLLHNMCSRCVSTPYIKLFDRMLSERQTILKFNDFLSDPISVTNGTTQGCPLSMLLYVFYNADLIEITWGKNESVFGFVDDMALVAVANTLTETHAMLKDMMEWPCGGVDWSVGQNSLYELPKLAFMDFTHPNVATPSPPLIIDSCLPNGTHVTSAIQNVQTYKYLGVVFDPKLRWRAHVSKVVASATWWTQQLWWISKTAGGLSPGKTCQLYNTVVIPAFTYASDVWYVPTFKMAHSQNSSGSVEDTKLLWTIQGTATRNITGSIRGSAYDMLEVHANTPPIDLLFCHVQFRAALWICSLPPHHPLDLVASKATSCFINKHRSPLHYLFYTTSLHPQYTETIDPTRHHSTYKPSLSTTISTCKDDALALANTTHADTQYKVYSDGSSFEGGIGASAVLYKSNRAIKSLRYYLGPATEHTVYESELVRLLLSIFLLTASHVNFWTLWS